MARTADSKAEYAAKFKDPRWQKVRLEVLNRDKWTCQKCKATDKTLHVHHKFYIFGKDPWDYHLHALVTLCEECHEEEESFRHDAPLLFVQILSSKGLLNSDMADIALALRDLEGREILDVLHGWCSRCYGTCRKDCHEEGE